MNVQNIILHLSLIDGVGPSTIQHIITRKSENSALQELYDFSASDWRRFGVSEPLANKLVSGLHDDLLAQELSLIEKYNIQWLTIVDDAYPELLKHIHLPPPVLYWKGSALEDSVRKLAIVGARKADQYGKQVIDRMVPELVAHDFSIVSGGALGADSMAHRATLDADGKTIAVLGSGLLRPYPREHKKLFERIIEHDGTILSAFPLRTDPYPGNFPARNRIIAGLSYGVVVVQAARKSGARITAQFALEQGRDVFAVPGSIDHELSDGCHALVQEGAKLITDPYDILAEYGIEKEENSNGEHSRKTARFKCAEIIHEDPIKQTILRACMQPKSIDDLSLTTSLSIHELQMHLFDLQVGDLLEQDFTGMWKLV